VDFFTPVVDDPFLYGQIAAANALSDVYAMRARPALALALAAFPIAALDVEVLAEILRGGAEKVMEAGAVIGGGHSIDHDVPLYGLAVTGFADESKITRNTGARPGDGLVLTKPLGLGVMIAAGRADSLAEEGLAGLFRRPLLPEQGMKDAIEVMTALNRPAAEAMEGFEIHAATDITGYGLLGHAFEMMSGSGASARFELAKVPVLPHARSLAARGVAPDGSRVNVRNMNTRARRGTGISDEDFLIVCDAQTSGGLLVALPADQAEAYAARARELGAPAAAVVGTVQPPSAAPVEVV
jgi:selenide,water dikinase